MPLRSGKNSGLLILAVAELDCVKLQFGGVSFWEAGVEVPEVRQFTCSVLSRGVAGGGLGLLGRDGASGADPATRSPVRDSCGPGSGSVDGSVDDVDDSGETEGRRSQSESIDVASSPPKEEFEVSDEVSSDDALLGGSGNDGTNVLAVSGGLVGICCSRWTVVASLIRDGTARLHAIAGPLF